MKEITIALAGNPNCGKTTLFNALTGSKQRVGNWPGVTVEHKEGEYTWNNTKVKVIDLPGIYSFSAYSLDEKVSREFILNEKPDVVVNILDSTNLERNLYLTTQLIEMKVNVIAVLNMADLAKQRKIEIELDHLQKHLDVPIVQMVAAKKQGVEELKNIINNTQVKPSKAKVSYDSVAEKSIFTLQQMLEETAKSKRLDARWLAIKLLEEDEMALSIAPENVKKQAEAEAVKIEKHTGDECDIVIADGRYGFIHGLAKDVVKRKDELKKTISDAIDQIVLNRFLGIPIFLGVMYLVFMLTINVGGAFIDFFDISFGTIFVDGTKHLLGGILPAGLVTFLADGIGGGIQTVATFIPPIFFMFFSLSILEDSGYMSRAAFVMDRFMRFIGLPGKAFIPMLVGFGCTVPAIMATRTLENNRDRILTVMMNPFMSCGARLPVYVLFSVAFFPHAGGNVVFSIYIIGVLLAVLTGLLFKRTILKGEVSTFVMELPPYHIPTFGGIMFHTWQKLKSFILRAGQVIIIVVIVLSFLNSIGTDGSFGNEDSKESVLAYIGKTITPIFTPMGITSENWPATVGLFTGIFAKEAVVGTLNSMYEQIAEKPEKTTETEVTAEEKSYDLAGAMKEAVISIKDNILGVPETATDPLGVKIDKDLSNEAEQAEGLEVEESVFYEMRKRFKSKTAAFAYLLFILIYAPCVAAIAAIYRETNLKWATFAVLYLSILAWIVSTLTFQASQIGSNTQTALTWIGVCIVIAFGFIIMLYKKGSKQLTT